MFASAVRALNVRHQRLEADDIRAAPRRQKDSGALLLADVDRAETKYKWEEEKNKRSGNMKGRPDREGGGGMKGRMGNRLTDSDMCTPSIITAGGRECEPGRPH